MTEWDANQRWRQQIERRLNEIGSMVKGNQKFQADRLADVIEQIDELRKELAKDRDTATLDSRIASLSKRTDELAAECKKIADWLKSDKFRRWVKTTANADQDSAE